MSFATDNHCLCPGLSPWWDWLWLVVKYWSHHPSARREHITQSDTGSCKENHLGEPEHDQRFVKLTVSRGASVTVAQIC